MRLHRHVALVFSLAVLCVSGCMALQGEPPLEDGLYLSDDIVLAIRFNPYAPYYESHDQSGYLVLVKADGSWQMADVGVNTHENIVWGKEGLFFSDPFNDNQLSKSGLKQNVRSVTVDTGETFRILTPDGKGYIAAFNQGLREGGYTVQRIIHFDSKRYQEWDSYGLYSSYAWCGERLVASTLTDDLDLPTRELVYSKYGNKPSYVDASISFVQIYPKPENPSKAVLGEIRAPDKIVWGNYMDTTPCVDGKMYIMTGQHHKDDEGNTIREESVGDNIMIVFDTNSGESEIIPITQKDSSLAPLEEEALDVPKGGYLSPDQKTFTWVSGYHDGALRSINLETAEVEELFIPDISGDSFIGEGFAGYKVTEKSAYILDEWDEYAGSFKFHRYDLATGEKTELISWENMYSQMPSDIGINYVTSFAINPTWLEKQEHS